MSSATSKSTRTTLGCLPYLRGVIHCNLEFRLNCKQRVTFYQGQISDNRFMPVDAA